MNTKIYNNDDYLKLQTKTFKRLKEIADEQKRIGKAIQTTTSVTDWDTYIKKVRLRLTALESEKNTLDTILKNIKNISGLAEAIAELQRKVG